MIFAVTSQFVPLRGKEKEGDFSPSSILLHFNYFLAKVKRTVAGAVSPVVVAQRA